jgi:hypothetical protein
MDFADDPNVVCHFLREERASLLFAGILLHSLRLVKPRHNAKHGSRGMQVVNAAVEI